MVEKWGHRSFSTGQTTKSRRYLLLCWEVSTEFIAGARIVGKKFAAPTNSQSSNTASRCDSFVLETASTPRSA